MTEKTSVEFWFDPTCPWTWVSALWMKEVEQVRDIEVTWHPFSLYFLNEGRELPENYRKHIDQSIGVSRVVTAVRELEGQEHVEDFYFALGHQIHNQANTADTFKSAISQALSETGLNPDYAHYAETEEYDTQLRASTQSGLNKVGDDVGVPIVALNNTAFFGPVLDHAPKAEEAGKVFDGAIALASFPGFYELKRSRKNAQLKFD